MSESKEPDSQDQMVSLAVSSIKRLADGNGVARADIHTISSGRVDRTVTARTDIKLTWQSKSSLTLGTAPIPGSTYKETSAEMTAFLKAEMNALAKSENISLELSKEILTDPLRWMSSVQTGFRVGKVSRTSHCHVTCEGCGGSGELSCPTQVSCHMCHDGKRACQNCSGTGTYHQTVHAYNPSTGQNTSATVARQCDHCWGSGRTGICFTCSGTQFLTCRRCGGSGSVTCSTCSGGGWFTSAVVGWLVGGLTRSAKLPTDAPLSFQIAMEEVEPEKLSTSFGTPGKSRTGSGPGWVACECPCVVSHVKFELKFGSLVSEVFECFGKENWFSSMPTFLDELLFADQAKIVSHAGIDPIAAMETAKLTKVGQDVIRAVGVGKKDDAETISKKWKLAISVGFVKTFLQSLHVAYDHLGSAVVRKSWMMMGPVAVAVAALCSYIGVGRLIIKAVLPLMSQGITPEASETIELIGTAMLSLIPTLIVWRIIGHMARKSVRQIIGDAAQRHPRQGRWAAVFAALSLLSYVAADAASGNGANASPSASEPRPSKQTQALIRPSSVLPVASASPVVPATASSQKITPVLTPRFSHPSELMDADIKGVPDEYRLQANLSALGFYSGTLDGQAGPKTKSAMDAMLRTLKREDLDGVLKGKSPLEIASAAISGKVHLNLPADDTIAATMSNAARVRTTSDDVQRLRAVTSEAVKTPGNPIEWKSPDGVRKWHVLALRPRKLGESSCSSFELGLKIDNTEETSKVELACLAGEIWRIRN